MTRPRVFQLTDVGREPVDDLGDLFVRCAASGMRIDARRMRPSDRPDCRWIGWRVLKGVTDPSGDISVFAVPRRNRRGLHAELVAGLPNVDPYPLCYDPLGHRFGFGNFVRWIFLAGPKENGLFGIDFSLICRPTAGVATTMLSAARVVRAAVRHGLPGGTEIVLLNPRMCEDPGVEAMRRAAGLRCAADWIRRAPRLFAPRGRFCPRCGLETLNGRPRYCHACGCRPDTVRKGG